MKTYWHNLRDTGSYHEPNRGSLRPGALHLLLRGIWCTPSHSGVGCPWSSPARQITSLQTDTKTKQLDGETANLFNNSHAHIYLCPLLPTVIHQHQILNKGISRHLTNGEFQGWTLGDFMGWDPTPVDAESIKTANTPTGYNSIRQQHKKHPDTINQDKKLTHDFFVPWQQSWTLRVSRCVSIRPHSRTWWAQTRPLWHHWADPWGFPGSPQSRGSELLDWSAPGDEKTPHGDDRTQSTSSCSQVRETSYLSLVKYKDVMVQEL